MPNLSTLPFYVIMIPLAIAVLYFGAQAEYKAVKKFYPEVTFEDYLRLKDKIRITPTTTTNGE